MIPILAELEQRDQWIAFFQRERAYAQIKQPHCRVDLQTSYLQITRLDTSAALRYTLGSRVSIEPLWQLLSRCNWSLKIILEGLESLEPGANLRDKAESTWQPDLSVRRSIAREQHLYSDAPLGCWPQPSTQAKIDSLNQACSWIAWHKIDHWESALSPVQWLALTEAQPEGWNLHQLSDGSVLLEHASMPSAQFKPRGYRSSSDVVG